MEAGHREPNQEPTRRKTVPMPQDSSNSGNAAPSKGSRADEAFMKVAPKGTPSINRTQFGELLSQLNIGLPEDVADNFFATMDPKHRGRVNRQSFLDWYDTIEALNDSETPSKGSGKHTSKVVLAPLRGRSSIPNGENEEQDVTESCIRQQQLTPNSLQNPSVRGSLQTQMITNDIVADLLKALQELDPIAAKQLHDTAVDDRFASILQKHMSRKDHGTSATSSSHVCSDVSGGLMPSAELAPFVSALALRHYRASANAPMPFEAAVLFLDISGFSLVTAKLAEEGHSAYVLSEILNAYFQRLITVVHAHAGDVIKFAGDAVYVIWPGADVSASEDERIAARTLAAERMAACSMELRLAACNYVVVDTGLEFNVHIGLAFGDVSSRIFFGPSDSNRSMPSIFQFVCGEPMRRAAIACSEAKAGEIVMDNSAKQVIPEKRVHSHPSAVSSALTYVDTFDDSGLTPTSYNRPPAPDEELRQFLPRPIADRILAGIDKFFLAEMRELAVLFVRYAGGTDEELWFNEVFSILHAHSCEIVQVINDDKGTHIVAAFNLYNMAESASDESIRVAAALDSSQSDSYVGIAAGESFCGVIGGTTACQWDISGPAVVRACRCMQHAASLKVSQVIDASILVGASDKSNLVSMEPMRVKGEDEPVKIYRLCDANNNGSGWELHFTHTLCAAVHRDTISTIKNIMTDRGGDVAPATVILKGPLGTGKFSVFLNSVDGSRFLPLVHTADESQKETQLGLLYTITSWFSSSQTPRIRQASNRVREALFSHRNSLAFKLAVDLLKIVSMEGKYTALIVRRAQLLDHGSIAFLGCLSRELHKSSRFIALLSCYPLYGFQHPEHVLCAFAHSKLLTIDYASEADSRALVEHCLKVRSSGMLANFVYSKSAGHIESIVELCRYMTKHNYLRLGKDGTMGAVHLKELRNTSWNEIAVVLQRKTIHLLDRLPPHLLTLVKIVCSIARQPGITAFFPSVSAVCRSVMKAKLDETDVITLEELCILRRVPHRCTAHTGDTTKLNSATFYIPPMRDIVQHVQVPQQDVEINYICGCVYGDTHPMNHPLQLLVRARHYHYGQQQSLFIEDLRIGWRMLHAPGAQYRDYTEIRTRFMDSLVHVPEDQLEKVVPASEDREEVQFNVSRVGRQRSASKPGRKNSGLSAVREPATENGQRPVMPERNTSAGQLSSAHSSKQSGTDNIAGGAMLEGNLYKAVRFRCPLALGPARQHYEHLAGVLFQLHEFCETATALRAEILLTPTNSNGTDSEDDTTEIPPFLLASLTRALTLYSDSLSNVAKVYEIDDALCCQALRKLRDFLVENFKDAEAARDECASVLVEHAKHVKAVGDVCDIKSIVGMPVAFHTAKEFPAVHQVLELFVGERQRRNCCNGKSSPKKENETSFRIEVQRTENGEERTDRDVANRALYMLFEDLTTILKLTSSSVRQAAFCHGLLELHRASLNLPEVLTVELQHFASFLRLWLLEEST